MAMDHARVAKDVLTYVGGADNINAAAHCATRLRLVLNDMDKVDQKALDKDPDLKGTFIAGGMSRSSSGRETSTSSSPR